MARTRTVVIDEIHLTLCIPNDLPDDDIEAVRKVLAGDDFLRHLRRAVRDVVSRATELKPFACR